MPAPPAPPLPMSPKRRGEKEKEKEKERRDQRDNVISAFRASSASAAVSEDVSHPPTLYELKELMLDLLKKQDDFPKEIDRVVKEIKSDYRKEMDNLSEGVIQNLERVDEKMESMEKKLEKKMEDQAIVAEAHQMQSAIRIRGLSETIKDNLEQEAAAGIADGMELADKDIIDQIDKIFRVNSRVAKERGLPRDVVIYFVKRKTRDLIIRRSFERKFRVAGQEIIIMKELPSRYIKRKKDYGFLAEELRKRKTRFKWEIPDGMTVTFQGNSIKLNSVSEAREFYAKLTTEGTATAQEAPALVPAAEEAAEQQGLTERVGARGGARPKMTVMELRERVREGRARTGK